MSYIISDTEWDKYKDIINGIHEDFNQDTIVWRRYPKTIPEFFEDTKGTPTDIALKVLIEYNYFRKWPVTRRTDEGEIDDQNMAVFINIEYLQGLGYINSNGYFDFDADKDRFLIDGYEYKCEGDTKTAQAKDAPLLMMLILKRKARATSQLTGEQT